MKITRFQVFGQRCSGTNALVKLIEANFPALQFTEEFGFKHWFVPDTRDIPTDVLTIVIARDVSQWVQSLHRNPWHAHPRLKTMSFSRFIRAEWDSVWDEDFWGIDKDDERYGLPIEEEMCPSTGRRFRNVLDKRSAKLENWLGVCSRSSASVVCNHANLVNDPIAVIEAVTEAARCSPKPVYEPISSYKGQREVPFEPQRYPELSVDDRAHIEKHIEVGLEMRFGLASVLT